MAIKLGIISDPISGFNIKKDTGFAMMMEAQKRGYEIYYMEMDDLSLRQGQSYATAAKARVFDDVNHWYELEEKATIALADLDVIEDDNEVTLTPQNRNPTQREGHKQVEVRQADEE